MWPSAWAGFHVARYRTGWVERRKEIVWLRLRRVGLSSLRLGLNVSGVLKLRETVRHHHQGSRVVKPQVDCWLIQLAFSEE
jgi:hypothetical protein